MRARLRVVPTTALARSSIARSTIIVMVATFGSAGLGFFREVVNAHYFGTHWELDTFLATATIPTIIFGIFNGALVSALVPTFSDYLARGADDDAWRLASTILNLLAILLVVGAIAGWVLAPYYVPLIAHGFPEPQMGVAVRMARWLMPSIVATSLAGVIAAMLNAHHRFFFPSIQGLAINVVTIATTLLLFHRIGIYALVLGTTLGLSMQLLVQLPAFLALGRYRFIIDIGHPGLARMWQMLGPIIVGSAAGQISLFFDRFFASTLSVGYMSGMNYALKLVFFPQQIFAAAIATVLFPLLASQFAGSNRAGVRHSVVTGLRLVNFIMIPAVCGLAALAFPIAQTLFERGEFRASSTELVAGLIPYAAFGMIALAANVVLSRCCFACQEARATVAISIVTVVINIVLSMVWLAPLGARGLLLANSVSQGIEMVLLTALVWKLLGGFNVSALLRSFGSTLAASLAMVGALRWIASLNIAPATTLGARAWLLCGELTIGVLVFLAVARFLRAQELDLAYHLILAKFDRHVPSAPETRDAPIA